MKKHQICPMCEGKDNIGRLIRCDHIITIVEMITCPECLGEGIVITGEILIDDMEGKDELGG